MSKVQYDEGPAARIVPGIGRVKRGEACSPVSAAQEKRLLAQGWRKAGGRKKSTAKKSTGGRKKSTAKAEPQSPAPTTTPPAA